MHVGSGGMFVQSLKFIEDHSENAFDISVYGSNYLETGKMNMAIRVIEKNLGSENADTFYEDSHKNLKVDFILANQPFNQSD